MLPIVSRAARKAAVQRERWKISPTSCIPTVVRNRSRLGSSPAICWSVVAGASAGTRVAVGDRARVEAADTRSEVGGGGGDDLRVERLTAHGVERTEHQVAVDLDVRAAHGLAQQAVELGRGEHLAVVPLDFNRMGEQHLHDAAVRHGGRDALEQARDERTVGLVDQRQRERPRLLAEPMVSSSALSSTPESSSTARASCCCAEPSPSSGKVKAIAPRITGSGDSAVRTRSARRTASVPRISGSAVSSGRLTIVATAACASSHIQRICWSMNGTRRSSTKPPRRGPQDASVATSGRTP